MKKFFKNFITAINIIACFFVVILGGVGLVIDIIGPANYEKITKVLKVSWTYKQTWYFSMIWFLILVVTFVILKLLSKDKKR